MKRYGLILFFITLSSLHSQNSPQESPKIFEAFTIPELYNYIHPLSLNEFQDNPLIYYGYFLESLKNFVALQTTYLNNGPWFDNKKIDLASLRRNTSKIEPFVFKYKCAPETLLFMWGDLHGDIKALVESFYKLYQDGFLKDDFTIQHQNTLFFFLGDFVDRGAHGPALLFLLFKFTLKNPGRVFLIRGNHEDVDMNRKGINPREIFYPQLQSLYRPYAAHINGVPLERVALLDLPREDKRLLLSFYNSLPVAAFVGCGNNYVQCCHGGFEVRYNPAALLAFPAPFCFEKINNLIFPFTQTTAEGVLHEDFHVSKKAQLSENYNSWMGYYTHLIPLNTLGFLWDDFNAADSLETLYDPRRGLILGKSFTEKILNLYSPAGIKVQGIIRAHQHNMSMPGLFAFNNRGTYSLWNDKVLTTIGTGMYTGAPTYIELVVRDDFNKWQLTSFQLLPDKWYSRASYFKNRNNIMDVYAEKKTEEQNT